jgi:hypothetical protein
LRRALPEAVIESRPAGYQLTLDPRCIDIVRFEDLVTAGRAQLRQGPAAAGQTLRQALALWRGPALADVAAWLALRQLLSTSCRYRAARPDRPPAGR